jgi:hypothetical protein
VESRHTTVREKLSQASDWSTIRNVAFLFFNTFWPATNQNRAIHKRQEFWIVCICDQPQIQYKAGTNVGISPLDELSTDVKLPPRLLTVIAAVEAAAKADKVTRLNLKSKHGVTLFDSSKIAGVDYTDDAIENQDDPYNDANNEYQSDSDEALEIDSTMNQMMTMTMTTSHMLISRLRHVN